MAPNDGHHNRDIFDRSRVGDIRILGQHDQIAEVPSYDNLVEAVHATLAEGHINLVETMAEQIAQRRLLREDAPVPA